MRRRLDRKGFLLLLLYAPGYDYQKAAPIRGRTRLAKLLFLLKEEHWAKAGLGQLAFDFYNFEPDDYGPFDARVFNDLDFFRSIGFIEVKNIEPLPGEGPNEYLAALATWGIDKEDLEHAYALEERYFEQELSLTPLGIRFVEEKILPIIKDRQLEAFSFVKSRFGRWPLSKLLRYIYSTYPEMTTKSKIRSRILGQGH